MSPWVCVLAIQGWFLPNLMQMSQGEGQPKGSCSVSGGSSLPLFFNPTLFYPSPFYIHVHHIIIYTPFCYACIVFCEPKKPKEHNCVADLKYEVLSYAL